MASKRQDGPTPDVVVVKIGEEALLAALTERGAEYLRDRLGPPLNERDPHAN